MSETASAAAPSAPHPHGWIVTTVVALCVVAVLGLVVVRNGAFHTAAYTDGYATGAHFFAPCAAYFGRGYYPCTTESPVLCDNFAIPNQFQSTARGVHQWLHGCREAVNDKRRSLGLAVAQGP